MSVRDSPDDETVDTTACINTIISLRRILVEYDFFRRMVDELKKVRLSITDEL